MDKQVKEKQKSSFSEMEEEILQFWDKSQTFQRSLKKKDPQGDFVFYDGPPFATGLPHYGHLVANIIKDVVPRYWTMKGYHVDRRWGWDCHGLPLENLAEEELNLKDKSDIEDYGVDKFNEYCRGMVLRYSEEWEKSIRRIARWVDMENGYRTMDVDYMESLWWIFHRLSEKNLIYKGYKSMHMCPRCGTTLSNFEVGLGYLDIKDLAVTAKFELESEPGVYFLAWTTTPWTLVGNVALAVGRNINYVKFSLQGDSVFPDGRYIVSQDYFDSLKERVTGGEIKKEKSFQGRDLVGEKYKPLFNYYSLDKNLLYRENGWQVYVGDFVTTQEGSGIVHIAPAFGEDDLDLSHEYNLPFVQHIDKEGKFKPEVEFLAGLEAKPKKDHQASDVLIIKYLAKHNLLFFKEKYEHSYPHCWRCDTPLLNYASDSWFIQVSKFREALIQNNRYVNWVPSHLKEGRFGKWLEQARDWAISRDRYWGTPLPVWECSTCTQRKIIGSKKELEELSGQKIQDLHKHIVDDISFDCTCGEGSMHRISEVLDFWYESGSMPYAQYHYPFENEKKFERNFPANFVAEGMDQTRGWFYTLMVISTALYGRGAFDNVVVNGIVLAEDGQKMSKSKKNFPAPDKIFDLYSVDATRYYLLSSSVVMGENLNFSEDGVKEVLRKVNMTLWNVYKFYDLFARTEEKIEAKPGEDHILDKWIVSRLNQLTEEVSLNMEKYLLPKAVRPIGGFIDDLSTWYLRRSRDRFKAGGRVDKMEALQTTKYTLLELSRIMAPFMPFLAERLWQKVSGFDFGREDRSVHLEDWPSKKDVDSEVLEKMSKVREIVELSLAKRDQAGIKVRQPLPKLNVSGPSVMLGEDYFDLIKEEGNVKYLKIDQDLELEVELDTELTPELIQEGIKRELVRLINNMRKNLGLTLSDRVSVSWQSEEELIIQALLGFAEDIKRETLSQEFYQGEMKEPDSHKEFKLDKGRVKIFLKK